LGFTTWRAVRKVYPSASRARAKRGELRGTACAGQDRASCTWGGRSLKSCATTPPQCRSCLLYENLCPAMDSCGVMGMFWGLSAGARTPLAAPPAPALAPSCAHRHECSPPCAGGSGGIAAERCHPWSSTSGASSFLMLPRLAALRADTADLWVRRPECLCSEDVRWRKLAHHCMEGPHGKQGAFRGCTCPRGVHDSASANLLSYNNKLKHVFMYSNDNTCMPHTDNHVGTLSLCDTGA